MGHLYAEINVYNRRSCFNPTRHGLHSLKKPPLGHLRRFPEILHSFFEPASNRANTRRKPHRIIKSILRPFLDSNRRYYGMNTFKR